MIAQADALHIPLAPQSVHCVITSPPYFGLRSYATGDAKAREIGTESLHDCLAWARGEPPCERCYVCALRRVFAEVWRVLRDDGTAWLNLGDSYAGSGKGGNPEGSIWAGFMGNNGREHSAMTGGKTVPQGLKPKDLIGIPWRVALALQADGWTLRSDIIWSKPNPMPESVQDRPTKAHEYVFLLSKRARYYYDAEAIKEELADSTISRYACATPMTISGQFKGSPKDKRYQDEGKKIDGDTLPRNRNRRSVWTVSTAPYPGAHYATWPPALVEPMLLAGTSARGVCPACGAPWERVTEREGGTYADRKVRGVGGPYNMKPEEYQTCGTSNVTTTGWRATCACAAGDPIGAVVLDPFAGSGTTGMVARLHGRRFVGLDLSLAYLRDQALARAEARCAPDALATLPLFAALDTAASAAPEPEP